MPSIASREESEDERDHPMTDPQGSEQGSDEVYGNVDDDAGNDVSVDRDDGVSENEYSDGEAGEEDDEDGDLDPEDGGNSLSSENDDGAAEGSFHEENDDDAGDEDVYNVVDAGDGYGSDDNNNDNGDENDNDEDGGDHSEEKVEPSTNENEPSASAKSPATSRMVEVLDANTMERKFIFKKSLEAAAKLGVESTFVYKTCLKGGGKIGPFFYRYTRDHNDELDSDDKDGIGVESGGSKRSAETIMDGDEKEHSPKRQKTGPIKCSCKSTQCLKKWCPCFFTGTPCNLYTCKCLNCANPHNQKPHPGPTSDNVINSESDFTAKLRIVEKSNFVVRTDIPRKDFENHPSGVLHAIRTTGRKEQCFLWIEDKSLVNVALQQFDKHDFNDVRFIPFSNKNNLIFKYPHTYSYFNPPNSEKENDAAAEDDTGAPTKEVVYLPDDEKAPKLFESGLLPNAEREELHLEIYKYLRWLHSELKEKETTWEGKRQINKAGISTEGVTNMLESLKSTFKVVENNSALIEKVLADSAQKEDKKQGPVFLEEYLKEELKFHVAAEAEAKRKARVDQTPFDFDVMFQQLVEYKEEHGHADPPGKSGRLGRWSQSLRKKRRTMQENGIEFDAHLTKERIESLDDVGFRWSFTKKPLTWEQQFENLKEFHQKHGHWSVPRSYPYSLGEWAHTQRKLQSKKDPRFMERRFPLLDAVGFRWVGGQHKGSGGSGATFDELFQRLVVYQRKYGHTNVPYQVKSSSDPQLGRWARRLRLSMKVMKERGKDTDPNFQNDGTIEEDNDDAPKQTDVKKIQSFQTLTPDRIKLLDAIGFDWDPEPFVSMKKKKKPDDQADPNQYLPVKYECQEDGAPRMEHLRRMAVLNRMRSKSYRAEPGNIWQQTSYHRFG